MPNIETLSHSICRYANGVERSPSWHHSNHWKELETL